VTYTFFFFQAEDGIRDATVTGVQTCALPISILSAASIAAASCLSPRDSSMSAAERIAPIGLATSFPASGGADPCTGSNIEVRPEIGRASCRERGEDAGGGGR